MSSVSCFFFSTRNGFTVALDWSTDLPAGFHGIFAGGAESAVALRKADALGEGMGDSPRLRFPKLLAGGDGATGEAMADATASTGKTRCWLIFCTICLIATGFFFTEPGATSVSAIFEIRVSLLGESVASFAEEAFGFGELADLVRVILTLTDGAIFSCVCFALSVSIFSTICLAGVGKQPHQRILYLGQIARQRHPAILSSRARSRQFCLFGSGQIDRHDLGIDGSVSARRHARWFGHLNEIQLTQPFADLAQLVCPNKTCGTLNRFPRAFFTSRRFSLQLLKASASWESSSVLHKSSVSSAGAWVNIGV